MSDEQQSGRMEIRNPPITFGPYETETIRNAKDTLKAAADKARSNGHVLLADVFDKWSFVARFGDAINRVGGPETVRLAAAYLLGPAPWKPVDIDQKD